MSKVISFSLWGNDKKCIIGAIENAKLCKKYYPTWACRFYLDKRLEQELAKKLTDLNSEVVLKNECNDYLGLYWRLESCYDKTIERVIIRDVDSRLNERESDAVLQWECTNYPVHIMRDHRQHDVKIMGGMFGLKVSQFDDFEENMKSWLMILKPNNCHRGQFWGTDQEFLEHYLWPKIKDNHLAHDDYKRVTGRELSFRVKLNDGQFVGQVWNESNNPVYMS